MQLKSAKKQRQLQFQTNNDIENSNSKLEKENTLIGLAINENQVKIKILASKHLRRLCELALNRNLKHWISKWNLACKFQNECYSKFRKLLMKSRYQTLQQVFGKYKRGFNFKKQDQYNSDRVEQVQQRLAVKQKKRVFNSIKLYSQVHIQCTKQLKIVLKMSERREKTRGMLQWQRVTKNLRELSILMIQREHVQSIDQLQQVVSKALDEQNCQRNKINRLESILNLEASKTLQKWVARLHLGGLRFGFVTWKQKTNDLNHRDVFLKNLRLSQIRKYLKLSWSNWRQASNNQDLAKQVSSNNHLEKVNTNLEHQMFTLKNLHEEKRDSITREIIPFQKESRDFSLKAQKVIQLLTQRRDQNWWKLNTRYFMQKWKVNAKHQRKCTNALVKGIRKLLFQRALEKIKQFVREEFNCDKKERLLQNLFKSDYLRQLRLALSKWRLIRYQSVIRQIQNLKTTEISIEDSHRTKIQNSKIHHAGEVNKQNYLRFMMKLFDFWHNYSHDRVIKRRQAIELQESLECYMKRRCLFKLAQQTTQKQIKKEQFLKLNQLKGQIYKKAVLDRLKFKNKVDRTITKKTYNLVNVFNCMLVKRALSRWTLNTLIDKLSQKGIQQQSCKNLAKIFDRITTRNLMMGQTYLQKHCQRGRRLEAILKQYMGLSQVWEQRAFFQKWREQIQKMAVVELNESEDGHVNLQCWHLRLQCNGLAEMMQRDGATDSVISNVINESNTKFRYLTDKSITRLMIHTDENLRLLPYCLDKLRSYTRVIKLWRNKIHSMNSFLEQNKQKNLYQFFRRWREQSRTQCDTLYSTPQQDLIKRSDKNTTKLQNAAESLDSRIKVIEDYKQQRDCLLQNLIGGQKLAVALIKAGQERTKQQSLNRVSDFGNKNLQSQIQEHINKNLLVIDKLKQRMSQLESQNLELSQQKDLYRVDAFNALQSHKLMGQLRIETEFLMLQHAQKDGIANKLIQDNIKMAKQLKIAKADPQKFSQFTFENISQQQIQATRITDSSQRPQQNNVHQNIQRLPPPGFHK